MTDVDSFATLKNKVLSEYPSLTADNFLRINILYYGISFQSEVSFPDVFRRKELVIQLKRLVPKPLLTVLNPKSPFKAVEVSDEKKVLFYNNKYVDDIEKFEMKTFDMRNPEPFYFYVKELNNEIVLKINPIQLCDFFLSSNKDMPCSFCFRKDMTVRFKNISTKDLVTSLLKKEKNNRFRYLKIIDEVSVITGTFKSDDLYLEEISFLIKSLKKYIPPETRIVVGSHEVKGRNMFKKLKQIGVTDYAFSAESLSDKIRESRMNNRKGRVRFVEIMRNIKYAIEVFGEDHVIIRLVAGLGDPIDELKKTVSKIVRLGKNKKGPLWNVNIYMPFTHYHWQLFQSNKPFTVDYLYRYLSALYELIDKDRFYYFKISP